MGNVQTNQPDAKQQETNQRSPTSRDVRLAPKLNQPRNLAWRKPIRTKEERSILSPNGHLFVGCSELRVVLVAVGLLFSGHAGVQTSCPS